MSEKSLLSSNHGASVSSAEAGLLKQINQGFSNTWWEHYHELIRRRQDSVLSDSEHVELIRLTNQVERRVAKRLRALRQLAELRGQSLASLMKELGLLCC